MSDLISRQDAIDAVTSLCDDCDSDYCGSCCVDYPGEKNCRKVLEDLPSAQPERRMGKWTEDSACEFCGFQPWYEGDIHTLSYCPNCGADMRQGEKDEQR